MKYLYGLSIQGIQSYIFSTNKLKEIIGASQLVSSLPKIIVEEIIGDKINKDNILIDAAGNFKYLFEDKAQCDLVIKNVPMRFFQLAGNITVSQAVVDTNNLIAEQIDELEQLLKIQRNRPFVFPDLSLMSMLKNPKTGKVTVAKDGEDSLDFEQKLKRDAQKLNHTISPFDSVKNLTEDIEKMTSDKYENWIGVIHADGNSLGKKIIQLSSRIKKEGLDVISTFREFSKNLQQATENAVKRAYDETIMPADDIGNKIPFRPIIIGGDDVTVITRGDLALDFTEKFLLYFEEETKSYLNYLAEFSNGLTACAGISYTKSHYPFHYGVDLAEILCMEAKKVSKSTQPGNAPSSLMFHKMHSSFVRDWDEIKEAELKSGKVNFANGPYFISEEFRKTIPGYCSVKELKEWANYLSEQTSPKSNIRQWLSEVGKDETRAEDLLNRTKKMFGGYWNKLNLEGHVPTPQKTHLYDALVIEDLISKSKI